MKLPCSQADQQILNIRMGPGGSSVARTSSTASPAVIRQLESAPVMTNPSHYFRRVSYLFALAISLASPCSYAQQNHVGATTAHGDPAQIVRQALLPLFQQKKGAEENETRFFSPAFKKLADDYFSVDENARDFDADPLLGTQDWSALTPSFSTFVLDDHHAKVQVSFTLDKKYANDPEIKTQPANIYTVLFDDQRGWTIEDIAYSEGITLRDIVSHNTWCHHAFHDQGHIDACKIDVWK